MRLVPSHRAYELLAVGEMLIDLLGNDMNESLQTTTSFSKLAGGSPANLASNMARLGYRTAIVAGVGADGLGDFLIAQAQAAGLDTTYVVRVPKVPTSLVVVSRSEGTPDFIAYRGADKMLKAQHIPDALLEQCAIFHTTCFALSELPAREAILDAAKRAAHWGCAISIDANYAPSIGPLQSIAWENLERYCGQGALVKLSDDDAQRLYSQAHVRPQTVFSDFHKMGAKLVCLTLGKGGSMVSYDKGREQYTLAPTPLEKIEDVTGAGDAFWSGFLSALHLGLPIPKAMAMGNNMAVLKLTSRHLPEIIDIQQLIPPKDL